MRVKKLLALLLSGAFFAGCLSGCDRTIIEHQFHTNTEYVTEEEISSPEIERNLGALTNIFLSNGMTNFFIYTYSSPLQEVATGELAELWDDFGIEDASDLDADVDDSVVNAFVCNELDSYGFAGIMLFQEYGVESECDSFTSAYSKLLGILSEKLKPFTKEDWIDKEGEYSLILYNVYITDLGKTYAAVILQRM